MILAAVLAVLFLTACKQSLETELNASPKVTDKNGSKESSEKTNWRMVWVDGFGEDNLPHEDLAPMREEYIRNVYITTDIIDGKFLTIEAYGHCLRLTREAYQEVYNTSPPTIKLRYRWKEGSRTCDLIREVGGKKYHLNWGAAMRDFIIRNNNPLTQIRDGNNLSWVNDAGVVIAKFQKSSEAVPQRQ